MSRLELFLEGNMKKLHIAIVDFLKKNPKPSDKQVHDLAKKMGIDPDDFEEHFYMILGDMLKEESHNDTDGFDIDIEKATLENTNFRKVLYTAPNSQLVVMSVKDDIGMETHEKGDQFIRIEGGKGKAVIDGREFSVGPNTAFVIPEGSEHNVINTGDEDLKLYAVYSPPNHPDGTVHKTKEDAE
jgi:mannose-6-phosphate isomerase-like protein (cupin superfamily)